MQNINAFMPDAFSAYETTYIVSGGALNFTHSLFLRQKREQLKITNILGEKTRKKCEKKRYRQLCAQLKRTIKNLIDFQTKEGLYSLKNADPG